MEKTWMEQIRANLRIYRTARGWSEDHLGKLAGYTNGTMIHQIEKGLKKPSYKQLQAIARALEVSVSDLTGDALSCRAVTNNANGNQVVYQYVEGLVMTEDVQGIIRTIVTEVLDARCEKLVQEIRMVLRETVSEAEADAGEPARED